MTALNRASELMSTKMNELPPLAREFAQHLCNKVGGCMEVFLTAFAIYAQICEDLPCDDPAYQPSAEDRAWFACPLHVESQVGH